MSPQIPPKKTRGETVARPGPAVPRQRQGTGRQRTAWLSVNQGPKDRPNSRTTMLLADLSMLLGSQKPATGSKRGSPTPEFDLSPAAPRAGFPTIQYPHCMPERRRIVAQVRREVRKNRGLLAAEKYAARC